MADITKLPIDELRNDRAESLMEIATCERLFANSRNERLFGLTVGEVMATDRGIVAQIDAELSRREMAAEIAWLRGALERIAHYDESDMPGYWKSDCAEEEMRAIALAHLGMYTGPESADADGQSEEF